MSASGAGGKPVRVFFSYSWDSVAHKDRVRELADRLIQGGIDCVLDQYEHPPLRQGWPTWMKEQVATCDFMLVVCSAGYVQKADGKLPGGGLGVRFESAQVLQGLYNRGMWNEWVLPVLVEEGGAELVWEPLQQYHFYRADTDDGYDDLYRRLTDQPALVKPPLGQVQVKLPRNASVSVDPRIPPTSELAAPWSKTGEDQYGHWAAFEVKGVEQRMRWLLPGRFWMGSPEEETGRYDDEGPRHEVELTRGFWLGEVPCTQALWEAVMGSNPSRFQGGDRPVETVSWDDCQRFLEAVERQRSGPALRLPTDAEWEYAARAGTSSARYHSDPSATAWYDENSGGQTHPVRGKRTKRLGLVRHAGECSGVVLGLLWHLLQRSPA
jgi:Sulfatase-modifying factor enzyme 1/TIR domain